MDELFANSGDPDQTPHSAASDLGLHCLPVTHYGVPSLQWVTKERIVLHIHCINCTIDLQDKKIHENENANILDFTADKRVIEKVY